MSGIAAVQGGRYDSLAEVFYASAGATEYGRDKEFFVGAVSNAIHDLTQTNVFEQLPGHEKHYAPMSEYLFKTLQPQLDDVLFVGKDYERAFDEFEVLLALAVADLRNQRHEGLWGPVGRFGWKRRGRGPLSRVIDEARSAGAEWAPIRGGIFGGKLERFDAVADPFLAVRGDSGPRVVLVAPFA
jgi:hypothetical protein